MRASGVLAVVAADCMSVGKARNFSRQCAAADMGGVGFADVCGQRIGVCADRAATAVRAGRDRGIQLVATGGLRGIIQRNRDLAAIGMDISGSAAGLLDSRENAAPELYDAYRRNKCSWWAGQECAAW